MKAHFTTFNHCPQGQRAVQELADIIGHQIAALGHVVSWTDRADFSTDGVNFVFESFADPNYPALPAIAEAHARGCRFVYVATEQPGASGAFNDASDHGMRDRQKAFPEAARYALGIIHLVSGDQVTEWYDNFAPAAYAELGYAPGLERPDDSVSVSLDFGFFGKRTVRREAILSWLQRYGTLINVIDFRPATDRDAAMRMARVIVQIREHAGTQVVSTSRCNTALHLGRPVVAEPHAAPGVWGEIIPFSKSLDAFVDDAVEALSCWREMHRNQMERFRDLLTPQRCIGEPLRKIGVL